MTSSRVIGMIPARWASSRLPGKPLEPISGKPMVQRVYERCIASEVLDGVWVVTDDERICKAIESFGGKAILTSPSHVSGTDRLAEAIDAVEGDLIVNVQGDQPFIDPVMIEEVVAPMLADPSLEICTLMHAITCAEDLDDPGVVKTVVDLEGYALYFSRARIPHPQTHIAHRLYEHVGLYVYRREFLKKLANLPPTILEQVESLEQLRVLEHGYRIRVVETKSTDNAFSGFSVDTQDDVRRAEAMLEERGLP